MFYVELDEPPIGKLVRDHQDGKLDKRLSRRRLTLCAER
jgi:hypothetical protein